MPNLDSSNTANIEWRVLSGPAILRISVLLIIAGALAALVQFLLPAEPTAPVAEPPAAARRAEPAPPAVPPASTAPPPASAAPAPQPPPAPAQDRRPAAPARSGPTAMPADALAFPPNPTPADTSPPIPAAPIPAAPPPTAPRGEAEVARAEDTAGPRALALVDLNTASVADLNRLQGGGTIGRAIVAKRPYASIDQLLSKRVLSRAIYDRIREQVTVR